MRGLLRGQLGRGVVIPGDHERRVARRDGHARESGRTGEPAVDQVRDVLADSRVPPRLVAVDQALAAAGVLAVEDGLVAVVDGVAADHRPARGVAAGDAIAVAGVLDPGREVRPVAVQEDRVALDDQVAVAREAAGAPAATKDGTRVVEQQDPAAGSDGIVDVHGRQRTVLGRHHEAEGRQRVDLDVGCSDVDRRAIQVREHGERRSLALGRVADLEDDHGGVRCSGEVDGKLVETGDEDLRLDDGLEVRMLDHEIDAVHILGLGRPGRWRRDEPARGHRLGRCHSMRGQRAGPDVDAREAVRDRRSVAGAQAHEVDAGRRRAGDREVQVAAATDVGDAAAPHVEDRQRGGSGAGWRHEVQLELRRADRAAEVAGLQSRWRPTTVSDYLAGVVRPLDGHDAREDRQTSGIRDLHGFLDLVPEAISVQVDLDRRSLDGAGAIDDLDMDLRGVEHLTRRVVRIGQGVVSGNEQETGRQDHKDRRDGRNGAGNSHDDPNRSGKIGYRVRKSRRPAEESYVLVQSPNPLLADPTFFDIKLSICRTWDPTAHLGAAPVAAVVVVAPRLVGEDLVAGPLRDTKFNRRVLLPDTPDRA